jgi:hypothetical protein
MREIKFRGRAKSYGKPWAYGDLMHDNDGTVFIETVEVDPDTVGQYTGLKDKNGVEIYEGDVVGAFCNTQIFEVKWCNERGGYFLDDVVSAGGCEPHPECLGNLRNTLEVLGNIHDNPELPGGAL